MLASTNEVVTIRRTDTRQTPLLERPLPVSGTSPSQESGSCWVNQVFGVIDAPTEEEKLRITVSSAAVGMWSDSAIRPMRVEGQNNGKRTL